MINARPLCRSCHTAQTEHEWEFPLALRREAAGALNTLLKLDVSVGECQAYATDAA